MDAEKLLTTAEVAERLRVTTITLARWRGQGRGPAFVKSGGKILYREDALAAHLEASKSA